MRRLLPHSLLAVLGALLVFAGCGGDGDAGADPAAVAPARAPVYIEATIDPDGETEENVRSLSQRLAGTDDPGAEIRRLLEESAREDDPEFSYENDVEPWIGEKVGVFITNITAQGTDPSAEAGIVFPTSDPDAARERLERGIARGEGGQQRELSDRSHRDVDYKVEPEEDTAVAIIDDYAVVGNEAAVRAAIDANEDESLDDADSFQQARGEVDEDALAFGYVRTSALVSGLGPQGAALQPLVASLGETVAFSLDPESDAIRLESASLGVRQEGAGEPSEVMNQLPGDSWLALGLSRIGEQLNRGLQQAGQIGGLAGFDLDQLLNQIRQETGLDVREDLLSWMGDGGVFVRGAGPADIGGALVVQSTDPEATQQAIPRLAALLRGIDGFSVIGLDREGVDEGRTIRAAQLPLPIHMAAAGDRFVIAVTDGALDAAIATDERLEANETYRTAGERLGDGIRPSFFLDMEPVRRLVDQTGAAEGEDAQRARRVLEQLTAVAAGTQRDDDVLRGRLIVGVRE
jgi:hypothetical protein